MTIPPVPKLSLPSSWSKCTNANGADGYRFERLPPGWLLRYSPDGNPYFQDTIRHLCTRNDPREIGTRVKNPVRNVETSIFDMPHRKLRSTPTLSSQEAAFKQRRRSMTIPLSYDKYDAFEHRKLVEEGSIRLLRWHGIEDPGLPSFSVEEFQLQRAPPFVALSYTWGSPVSADKILTNQYDPEYRWPVLCDGKIALVSKNLHDFLQQKGPGFDDSHDSIAGGSALHYAAYRGRLETLSDLIAIGAHVNARDRHGRTPLFLACTEKRLDVAQLLLSHAADPNVGTNNRCNYQCYSPLHVAIVVGDVDVARALVHAGASVEATLKTGHTCLHHAACQKQPDMVRLFLAAGATTETESFIMDTFESAGTPLIAAVISGDMESLRILTEHNANLNSVDGWNRCALYFAAERDSPEMAQYLLQHGANPSIKSRGKGWQPIHLATAYGCPQIIINLLEAGAEVDVVEDERGRTPFSIACEFDRPESAKILLERGARIDSVRQRDQLTPLHMACWSLSVPIVEKLLARGADVHAQDSERELPLHKTVVCRHVTSKEDVDDPSLRKGQDERQLKIISLLLSNGALVDAQDAGQLTPVHNAAFYGVNTVLTLLLDSGSSLESRAVGSVTPMMRAAAGNKPDTIRLLHSRGAGLEQRDDRGRTALIWAICLEAKEAALALIDIGAGFTTADKDGNTPLHEAAFYGLTDLVRHFIYRGASIDTQNLSGWTALDYAVRERQEDCIKALEDRGAMPSTVEPLQGDSKPENIAPDFLNIERVRTKADQLHKDDRPGSWGIDVERQLDSNIEKSMLEDEIWPSEEIDSSAPFLTNRHRPEWMWIDAISINQADEMEKQTQVNLMGEIYRRAAVVQVWLGLEDRQTYLAAQAIRKVVTLHTMKYEKRESDYSSDLMIYWYMKKERFLPKKLSLNMNGESIREDVEGHQWLITPEELDAFTSVIHRQWFSRVWIAQEISHAKHVQMSLGTQNIVWEDLYRALTILTPGRDVFATGPQIWKRISEGSQAFVCAELRSRIRPGGDYEASNMRRMISWSEASRLPLAALLLLTWTFKATDPRDKVYALLGLATDWDTTHRIQPDYTRSALELNIEVAQLLMEGFNQIDDPFDYMSEVTKQDIPELEPLEIITFACQRDSSNEDLPSWAPKLGSAPHGPRLWNPGYKPAGDLSAKWSFPSPRILRTYGSLIGAVELLECAPAHMPLDDPDRFIYWLHVFPDELDKRSWTSLFYCLAVFLDTDRSAFPENMVEEALVEYLQHCAQKRILYELAADEREQNLLNWRDIWDRLVSSGGEHNLPRLSHLENKLSDAESRKEMEAKTLADIYEGVRPLLAPLSHYLHRRVLFRATDDNVGIATEDTQVGDRLCALGGAPTLFVVRQVQGEPPQWQFIGEAMMPYHSKELDIQELEFQ